MVPKAGIVLNNTMDDFAIHPSGNVYGLIGNEANALQPKKRPLSSMAPTIILQESVRRSSGGRRAADHQRDLADDSEPRRFSNAGQTSRWLAAHSSPVDAGQSHRRGGHSR
jgi:hypothetical protein